MVRPDLAAVELLSEPMRVTPVGEVLSAVGKRGGDLGRDKPSSPSPLAAIAKSGADFVASSYQRNNDSLFVVDHNGETQRIGLTELNHFRENALGNACNVTYHGLTPQDWLQYVPVLEYEELTPPDAGAV
jgi:hypothetical protein